MNGTLKLNSEWQEARAAVEAAGLPSYYQPPAKSWGALRACNYILANASLGVIDFRCVETTVQWLGLDYTFIDFSLKRLD